MRSVVMVLLILCCAVGFLFAQDQMDRSPYQSAVVPQSGIDAPFDIQLSWDLALVSGANGNAGAEFDGTYFYTTRWASNLLHKYDITGALVEEFSIPGVTGLRDLAFDGTYVYGGAAANTIYQMDFATKTLIGTITSPVAVRHIAYDESADAFWVGTWDTPVALIDRSGTQLMSLPNTLIAKYGSAYDKWTPGGPYLWVFNQDATAGGSPQNIHQFDLNTLTPTGVTHDVFPDFPAGATAIAGGLFTAEGIVPGKASIGGVLQGLPDYFFVYELALAGDPTDPSPPSGVAAYSDFNTPTSMLLTWTDPTTLVSGDPITPFTIEIDRDGLNIASVASGTGTYTDMGLTDGQLYTYDVYAKLVSNDSTSSLVTVSWHAGGDPVPAAPENLMAVASGPFDAVLTWTDPTTQADGTPLDDFDHINVYRDGVMIGTAAPGAGTYTDTPGAQGFYTYTVTAVDNETPPNESDPSNEAGAFVGTAPDFLVWVHPDVVPGTASAASGDSLFEALVANGQSAYLTNNLFEFGTDLSGQHVGIFVVLGIFANNGVLAAGGPEALALDTYLAGGGGLYLEGGDCFFYDPQFFGGHDINPWFDCVPLSDGSADVFNVVGLNEMSAFTFAYGGENNWMDHLSSGGLSSEIWQEGATLNIHGLYYDGYGGVAIGVVPSFGGMTSSAASMVNSQKRDYKGSANQKPEAGSYKARQEQLAKKTFLKRGGYKPELAARIDRSKPLYKITPNGIEFLANTQDDLMAAYVALMNPAPELMYYKFNEVGSTTTQNYAAAGTPVPATATVNGGLTMGGTGYEGSALIGTAGSSGTDYVDTGWITNLSGSWSISLWVNDMETTSATTRYFFGDGISFRCFVGGVAGNGNLLLRGTGMTDVLVSGVAPGPSEVTFVYDEAVLEIRAYLNGVLVNTVAQAAPLSYTGTTPFKVGAYGTVSAGIPLNCLLDEFKMYNRAIDVTPNSRDYAVTRFVDLPPFWYVGVAADVKAMVVNEGSDAQTDVPVRFFVDGTQVGGDVLVSLVSGDSAEVSFPWTPATAGTQTIQIQSFLSGDQDPANDAVSTMVDVNSGVPVMTVTPTSFDVTLEPPQTQTETMTIGNVAGGGPLDFTITIEGVSAANAKIDLIAEGQARSAPIISRGKEIPVEEYLSRANVVQKTISVKSEHPEDQVEQYDQILPSRPGNGLQKISGIGFDGPDGEEVFGNTSTVYGPLGARGRGNHFFCSTATTLTEHRLYLNMTANSDMQFLVYEGTAQVGIYNLINVSEIASSGTGQGWYSSGSINVPLVAGRYYLIYPQWTASANYYANIAASPYPIPTSFGELQMGVGNTWAPAYLVPPAATQNVPATAFGNPVAYYQTIVTGAGTSWLSVAPESGSVTAGQSFDVQVTFDAAGLLGGDYYANIIVNGNDPANLADTVSAHLFVQGAAVGAMRPDTDFGQVFVNGSADASMWVVNEGNGVMNVSDITSSATEFTVAPTAFDVPPFDSVEVTVTFAPTAVGTVTGSLTVTSNATNDPFGASVTGQGVEPPVIGVIPTEINEAVAIGDTMDVAVQISNTGGANLLWDASLTMSPAKIEFIPFHGPVSEQVEAAPTTATSDRRSISIILENPWDMQISWDLALASGANGNAGAEFDGTYYYTTRWASNLLHKYDMAGALVEEFSISGVTGLRDLAFDGTFMYGGAAANIIYQMDLTTKTLIGTINSPVAVRHIAYDEANDAFWVGTWDTPIALIDRSGTQLMSLPNTLIAKYGSAYDNWSPGGPYLWVFNQDATAGGSPQNIHQFDLNTLTPTGFAYNVFPDVPSGATAIAGGLFTAEDIVSGTASIGGVMQGVPDYFFVYELASAQSWMSIDPSTPPSGTVAPGDVGGFILQLHPYDPAVSMHTGSVVITNNDPVNSVVTIPVDLTIVGIAGEELLPTTFAVSRNYPNPFNPTTTIDYQLPQTADVTLEIYNVLGQKVRTLVNTKMAAGRYQAVWDARNDAGSPVGSGVYIYRFQAGDYKNVQKMVLLK